MSVPLAHLLNKAMQERLALKESGGGASSLERTFIFTFELVPARASRSKAINEILLFAEAASRGGLIHALSITDNAGGHPALAPASLGKEIKGMGIEPIIHFSCKDKNRNMIESQLFELDRAGIRNLLILTGDYPSSGYQGIPKPVFDLDSVHVLEMISTMNRGYGLGSRHGVSATRLPPMDFQHGCVVSPFKRLKSELVPQYLKLKRKIMAGAGYIITQMGFDARKFDELRIFMDTNKLSVPLLGTVFISDIRLARIISRGKVPGCMIPARLLSRMEAESTAYDGGLSARLERASRLVAVLMGIGYEGVHLSGPGLTYPEVAQVIKKSRKLAPLWREIVSEFLYPEEWRFWYYKKNPETGLNTTEAEAQSRSKLSFMESLHMRVGCMVHNMAFIPGKGLYSPLSRMAERIHGSTFENSFTALEYMVKSWLYDCRHCGDCTLGELGFLCPQSQCAKFLLNGPCGGSTDGWCEVWPGKRRCMYARIYDRLTCTGELFRLESNPMPPRNWGLYNTSSWINFYLKKGKRAEGAESNGLTGV
ncbi:MAG TPA: methylenetetrahydrofolate reductase [Thermodesulfobacteriaceae bacterium]|nr:methylenetetrahydrofolate reductase [Thermodesulfobacteriaceae bacterium]